MRRDTRVARPTVLHGVSPVVATRPQVVVNFSGHEGRSSDNTELHESAGVNTFHPPETHAIGHKGVFST